MQLSITVVNQGESQAKIRAITGILGNLDVELRDIGKEMVDWYSDKPFVTEGGIYGKPWQALKPGYEKWKAENFPGRGILERTGVMRKSFKAEYRPSFLRIYNETDYFDKHQEGLQGMPVRTLIDLTEERKRKIAEILKAGIDKRMNAL